MNCSDEELVLLATTIAMELAKGMNEEEIENLRNLVNQISCSLSALINCRGCSQKKQQKDNQKQ